MTVVDHRVTFFEPFELNGHTGYEAWNDSTGEMSMHCQTCAGRYGGSLCLDRWGRRRESSRPLVWERHADPLNHPVRGQRYAWEGMTYIVTRVSEAGRWADIRVEGEGGWSKRQPLPLPAASALIEESSRADG